MSRKPALLRQVEQDDIGSIGIGRGKQVRFDEPVRAVGVAEAERRGLRRSVDGASHRIAQCIAVFGEQSVAHDLPRFEPMRKSRHLICGIVSIEHDAVPVDAEHRDGTSVDERRHDKVVGGGRITAGLISIQTHRRRLIDRLGEHVEGRPERRNGRIDEIGHNAHVPAKSAPITAHT